MRAGLVRKVDAFLRDLLPRDAPATLHGAEESLLRVSSRLLMHKQVPGKYIPVHTMSGTITVIS